MKIKCRTCGEPFTDLPTWTEHLRDVPCSATDFDLFPEAGDKLPVVEPTPRLADECKKLLDNGWQIGLYKNALGSYSATAWNVIDSEVVTIDTDDFEPSAALYRLTEKVFGNIV